MWRRKIMESNRNEAQTALKNKLFILDDTLGRVLLNHRSICCEMSENASFVEIPKNATDVKT